MQQIWLEIHADIFRDGRGLLLSQQPRCYFSDDDLWTGRATVVQPANTGQQRRGRNSSQMRKENERQGIGVEEFKSNTRNYPCRQGDTLKELYEDEHVQI